MYRAWDSVTGHVVAERLRLAHTHWTRLKGLLGTKALDAGDGLWLKPCKQVHMIGMRYAIDVVFMDDGNRVMHSVTGLRPGAVSPRVASATSVLELPAGTLARVGLRAGAHIQIDGQGASAASNRIDGVCAAICNLALAVLFGFFAAIHIAVAQESGHWATTVPIIAQEALLVALFLVRRRSVATSPRSVDWALGSIGTFLPMALRPLRSPSEFYWVGAPLQIVGLSLAVTSLMFLGRSFALVAANRGIKTAGVYRIVRHPTYAGYVVSYVGYVLSYPTLANSVIVTTTVVLLNARAIVEERFLAQQDTRYQTYLREVNSRFLPYIY